MAGTRLPRPREAVTPVSLLLYLLLVLPVAFDGHGWLGVGLALLAGLAAAVPFDALVYGYRPSDALPSQKRDEEGSE